MKIVWRMTIVNHLKENEELVLYRNFLYKATIEEWRYYIQTAKKRVDITDKNFILLKK